MYSQAGAQTSDEDQASEEAEKPLTTSQDLQLRMDGLESGLAGVVLEKHHL